MEQLPFSTKEEILLTQEQAREEDPVAIDFLWQTFRIYIWPRKRIQALNLLIDSGLNEPEVNHFRKLREEATKRAQRPTPRKLHI